MKKFSTSILNSAEVHTSGLRINAIINLTISDDLFLKRVDALLKKAIDKLALALGRTNNPEAVKLLDEKDKIRNARFISFRDYCKGFACDTDAELAEAAATIIIIIRELGWSMYNKGYATKSSLMKALIDRLGKEPVSSAITVLNAGPKLEALEKAYNDFELAFKTKVEVKVREVYPLISDSRVIVVRYQAAMLSYIDMMAELDKGMYREAEIKIEEVITEFEAMARARKTRKIRKAVGNNTEDETSPLS